jgi:hypothetical protein
MTELTPELELIGTQLCRAYGTRLHRRRTARAVVAAVAVAGLSAVAALGATGDLQLDPTKWEILSGGTVDNGRGEYVHAKSLEDGGPSTFMVEHDAGMDRYQAFQLHERLRAAADETSPVPVVPEPGPLCTPAQLTRAEQTALDALRAKSSPQAAVAAAFANDPCRGLEYGTEIAQRVFTGNEPAADLMPGVS